MTGTRDFKADDMVQILKDGVREFGYAEITDDLIKLANLREENGQCITGLVNDVIIGCGGIDLLWEGVGEVWLFLSPDVANFTVKSYRVIKKGLRKLIKDNNLIRTQAWGRVGFNDAHTLFRHLGFKPEGIARKYAPDGADCILYSIVE
ncbi:MAG: hypothetical protein KAS32_10800 [Candidatus Peribacteraceae bacterium]|nr:hypothetical protein [Candidatus Peribacteraceae bacterium]